MADTVTPKLGMTKPEVGASSNSWGNKLNGNFDILDQKAVFNTAQWSMTLGDASPTGGPFFITRYNNSAVAIDNPISVDRQTGDVSIIHNLGISANIVMNPSGASHILGPGIDIKGDGNITTVNLMSTSISNSGAIGTATLNASGQVTAGSFSTVGAVSAGSVTASGAMNAGTLNVSGAAAVNSLTVNSVPITGTPPVPQFSVLSAPSSGIYNTPAGARQLRVRMCAGGAGGGGGAANNGTSGTNSLFGAWSCVAGTFGTGAASGAVGVGGTGGANGVGVLLRRAKGGHGGQATLAGSNWQGGAGGGSEFSPSSGVGQSSQGGIPAGANSGGGGGGGSSGTNAGSGGGGGEYVEFYINNPAVNYNYTVGAKGIAGAAGGAPGGDGGDGMIIVEAIF
jgi:hypothetical protein